MTIGIAIPTFRRHLPKLIDLLDTIQQSTMLPDQVSISGSGCSYYQLLKKYNFPIILSMTEAYRNPSMNRNLAADNLSTDLISFIDGDDLMHPQRIEFLLSAFDLNKCDAIVHDYQYTQIRDNEFLHSEYTECNFFNRIINIPGVDNLPRAIYSPTNSNPKLNPVQYHNAHITIRKEIFTKFRYDENDRIKYLEDSEYTNRLVKNGIALSYIQNKLSNYIKPLTKQQSLMERVLAKFDLKKFKY